jgi:hypothetical protein
MPKALAKANNDLISWCGCEELVYATSGQADCPWCGCGWLFTCINCRKAFTFAVVTESELSLPEIFARDRSSFSNKPVALDDEEVRSHAEWLEYELKNVHTGTICAILDGKILPVESRDIQFNGWFASHDLETVPQWTHRTSKQAIDRLLGNPNYWTERELSEGYTT